MTIIHCIGESYKVVEYWHKQGYIDETDWELYQFYWRNGAPRFSEVSRQYQLNQERLDDGSE